MGWALLLVALVCAQAGWGQAANDEAAQARALVDAGKVAEAESLLRQAVQRDPKSADAHFLLGYVLFRELKAKESLAEFTAGAQVRRPDADDFRVIASDYVLLADYADAEKWFAEVTKERQDDPAAWYLLGRAQYNEDHFTTAIASFERALELRPQYIEAENNLGLAYQGLNDPARATAAFRTAVEWQQNHPVDAQPYLNLGALLSDQNQPDQGLAYLETAQRLAPKNPKIHEELGRAYDLRNELPQAQHELEQAAALAPNASGLHFKLGQIYRREGMRDKAEQEFAICAKLNSTHSSMNTPNPYTPN
jgi:tetratricopeptide (TPR) repeat protein